MNRLLLLVLATAVGLSACSKKQETTAPAAPTSSAVPAAGPTAPPTLSAATPNTGKVLQVLQAGSYTYAEVETEQGDRVWIAGGPLQVKAGDSIQWGDFAIMQNFNSKTLNRTFDRVLFVQNWGPVGGNIAQMAPHGGAQQPPGHPAMQQPAGHPPMTNPMAMGQPTQAAPAAPAGQAAAAPGAGQGEVKSVANAGGYTYLEVKQNGETVWLAVPETSVKAGDKVTWNSGMVMRNFNAKSLNRTFDQIVFAGGVSVGK